MQTVFEFVCLCACVCVFVVCVCVCVYVFVCVYMFVCVLPVIDNAHLSVWGSFQSAYTFMCTDPGKKFEVGIKTFGGRLKEGIRETKIDGTHTHTLSDVVCIYACIYIYAVQVAKYKGIEAIK